MLSPPLLTSLLPPRSPAAHALAQGVTVDDTSGTFAGTLPCADCSGFAARITLTSTPHTGGLRGRYTESRMDNMGEAWTTPGSTYNPAAPVLTRGTWQVTADNGTTPETLVPTAPGGQQSTMTFHLRNGVLYDIDETGSEDAALISVQRLPDGHEYPALPSNFQFGSR